MKILGCVFLVLEAEIETVYYMSQNKRLEVMN